MKFLLDQDFLIEALDFTKELYATSPYRNYLYVVHKKLYDVYLQQKKEDESNITSSIATFSSMGDRVNSQTSTNDSSVSQSGTLVSSQFAQTSSIVADKEKQLASSMNERKTDDFINFTPIDELDAGASLGTLDSTSWWDKVKLFIERSQHYPHPKKKFGTLSFIGVCVVNVFFLVVIASVISSPLIVSIVVPCLIFLFTPMLLIGRCLRFGMVGFICTLGFALFWAIGGFLLVEIGTKLFSQISPPIYLIVTAQWLLCAIACIWGGVWHWMLFKE